MSTVGDCDQPIALEVVCKIFYKTLKLKFVKHQPFVKGKFLCNVCRALSLLICLVRTCQVYKLYKFGTTDKNLNSQFVFLENT